jgi:ectoine hydroxylase-related dioxygenase (phytanoyl-CoA dioxygenase family)
MNNPSPIPLEHYGILERTPSENVIDIVAESVKNLGYAILDSGLDASEIKSISDEFNRTRSQYIALHGESTLKNTDEFYTIRSPLTHGGPQFLQLALNKNLLTLLRKLIAGKFILNQQNGIINPPNKSYNQGAWHRDLPYQHFISTKPLAVNALFCLDDFTYENGGTFVLPATHKTEAFPSEAYISSQAVQIKAKAGSFIILDCMTFHAGGFNSTQLERRAVNHVFTIPFFKQQINIPLNIQEKDLSNETKEILGFNYQEPPSISDFILKRVKKNPG